jgi:hypothetical protein
MYRASLPVFVRGLDVLAALLKKAEAHADEHGTPHREIIEARLAPDMFPLAGQIQRATDTSKLSAERLSGVAAPRFEDNETTFAELHARIANTKAYMSGIGAAQLDGSESREIALKFGSLAPVFSGDDYLLSFGLPNFYFHVTTAYDILRHLGVQIGKRDFLGPYA